MRMVSEGLLARVFSAALPNSLDVDIAALMLCSEGTVDSCVTPSTVGINLGSSDLANSSSNNGISVNVEAIELAMLTVVTDENLECDDPNEERLLRLSENLCLEAPDIPAVTA